MRLLALELKLEPWARAVNMAFHFIIYKVLFVTPIAFIACHTRTRVSECKNVLKRLELIMR